MRETTHVIAKRWLRSVGWLVLIGLGLINLPLSTPALAQTLPSCHVSGSITENQTWTPNCVYVVTNHITVQPQVTLTIQAGTIIKFYPEKLMGIKGVLKVNGTAQNKVIFTSLKDDSVGGDTNEDGSGTVPDRGNWGHISFLDSSVDNENIIEHAILKYGGYFKASGYEYYGCWNCTYYSSIRFVGASPTVRNNTIEQSNGYALMADVNAFPVLENNTLINNGGNGLQVPGGTFATPRAEPYRWSNTDIVYVLTGHLTVNSGVTLAIDPGVKIKVAPEKLIGVKGVLKIEGTAQNRVIFTSLKDDSVGGDTNNDGSGTIPEAGNWGHIAFLDSSVDNENIIEHAILKYGGYFKASGYEYYGCWNCTYYSTIRFGSASPTVKNNTIEQSRGYALVADVNAFPVVQGNTLINNGGNGLQVLGGTFANPRAEPYRWSNTDIVYVLTGHLTVNSGVTLAIDPGVKIKVAPEKLIGVKGVLKIEGTAQNRVIFTSLKDDSVGGDTNNDGSGTIPGRGNWGHIAFFDSSVDNENIIEHAILKYGGYFRASGYEYYGCWNCTFLGAIRFHAASPTIANIELTENNHGFVAKDNAEPTLTCNNIYDNDGLGLKNESAATVTIDAKNQWWGHVSGPTHIANPSGTGQAVSDGVDYTPWRTQTCLTDIGIDTTPPTGSILINNGAATTTVRNVSLTLSATDADSGVADMLISNANDYSGATWQSYATTLSWMLPDGAGPKTVYAKFRDQAGNVSSSYLDTINYQPSLPPPFGTTMHISPTTTAGSVGVPLTLTVALSQVTNLGSFEFDLTYNADKLAVQAITLGQFPSSTGRTFSPVDPVIDNVNGRTRYGAFSFGSTPPGANGSGILAYVRLLPKANGSTNLNLEAIQMTTVAGDSIAVASQGAVVHLNECLGDFDSDGDVDIFDIQPVAVRWNSTKGDGTYSEIYDVDKDDDIDIVDVQLVAYRWGQICNNLAVANVSQQQNIKSSDNAPVDLLLNPAILMATPGQTYTLDLMINDATDLGAFEFSLAYNVTLIEVVDVSLGDFPGSSGRTIIPTSVMIDEATGKVSFGAFSLGIAPDGPNGNGVLATLTLKALTLGESDLRVTHSQISDRFGTAQTVNQVSHSQIYIESGASVTRQLYLPITHR